MTEQKEFQVIVVNWNTKEDLRECLSSFLEEGVDPQNLTVIDQGSTDGSLDLLESDFPGIHLARGTNQSYGGAINDAIRKSSLEYVIFCNADVQVQHSALNQIKAAFEGEERVAMVGPQILSEQGKRITRFSRTSIWRAVLLEILPQRIRGSWRDYEQKRYAGTEPFPVRYVEGAFAAVRKSVFEGIGGFDEGFSFFYEDYDLALRFRRAGFIVVHVPTAVVVHKGGRSFSQVPEKQAVETIKNLLLFYARHAARRGLWLRRVLLGVIGTKVFVLRLASLLTNSEHFGRRFRLNAAKLNAISTFLPSQTEGPSRIAVSVIIPTRDRQCVFDLLDRLRLQTFQDFEIVVVEQGSTNQWDTYDAAPFNDRLRVIKSSVVGRSNAKNLGIYHSRGSLLMFCDDDILPPPEFVGTHVSLHQKGGIGGVSLRHTETGLPYIRTKNMCRITWYGRMIDNYQSDITTYIETLTGPNMSFTREVQLQSGLFESGLKGTSIFEEQEYSERIRATGRKILFSNDISFPHVPQADGNKSLRAQDPATYYRSFHHNEILFFLKNRPRIQLAAVIPFCLLRSIRQSRAYKRPLRDAWTMFRGVFEGARSYYREL